MFGWTVDEALSFRLLDAWLDAGFNFIDTADVYSSWVPGHSGGESETIIGKWLRQSGKRDRVVLATKLGKPMGEGKKGLSPAYIHEAVDASLRAPADRSHRPLPIPRRRPGHAAFRHRGSLRGADQGRQGARDRGLELQRPAAGRGAGRGRESLGLPRYEGLQPLYNLYDRAVYEQALEPCAARAASA